MSCISKGRDCCQAQLTLLSWAGPWVLRADCSQQMQTLAGRGFTCSLQVQTGLLQATLHSQGSLTAPC